jgi:hypothetical protein
MTRFSYSDLGSKSELDTPIQACYTPPRQGRQPTAHAVIMTLVLTATTRST